MLAVKLRSNVKAPGGVSVVRFHFYAVLQPHPLSVSDASGSDACCASGRHQVPRTWISLQVPPRTCSRQVGEAVTSVVNRLLDFWVSDSMFAGI